MSEREIGEELLREASDLGTSGDRLTELVRWSSQPPFHKAGGKQFEIGDAALANPSLPVQVLREHLLRGRPDRRMMAAWTNPATAVVMMVAPLPDYEECAWRLLLWMPSERDIQRRWPMQSDSLRRLVASWAATAPVREVSTRQDRYRAETRAMARRMATLFSLPWPAV